MEHEGAEALAPVLPRLTALTELQLGSNKLGLGGIRALAPALTALVSLKSLHITTHNNIETSGWHQHDGEQAVALLASVVQQMQGLELV